MKDPWATIHALHAWVRRENDDRLLRLLKVTEEVGEVAQAYIGMVGQNPRKGVTHTSDDVINELVDVIVTAMVAMCDYSDDPGARLDYRIELIARRAALAAPAFVPPSSLSQAPLADVPRGSKHAANHVATAPEHEWDGPWCNHCNEPCSPSMPCACEEDPSPCTCERTPHE